MEADEGVGVLLGDLLDLDPTLGREHEQRLLDATIERQREVVLLRDVGRLLDPEALDDVALDVEPDDVLRVLLGLVRVGCELDAARLAAPAREHLGLDDDRAAEHLRRLPRLAGRRRQPTFADRDSDAPEELLALVFVEIHSAPSLPARLCEHPLDASRTPPCSAPRRRGARGRRLRGDGRGQHGAGDPRRTAADRKARLARAVPGRRAGARLRRRVVRGHPERLVGATSRSRTGPTSAGRSSIGTTRRRCSSV